MPITPRCHPSPSTTSRRASHSSESVARRVSIAASARASVSRRSRLSRSSLPASSLARAASRVQNSSMMSDATSMRPAALMRGATRNAISNAVIGFEAGSSCAAANIARNPAPTGRRSSRRPSAAITRFSPRSGTASAIVAMAAILRKLGKSLSRVRSASCRSSRACASLSAIAAPAQRFFRIAASVLIGIENRERTRDRVINLREVVIRNDQVKAKLSCSLCLGECAHPGVNGNDEADAIGIRGLEHCRLQAVSLANPMRNVKAHRAAKHFNGGLEQYHCGCSVNVVVAVQQDRLFARDGALNALDGSLHAQHQQGVV